jgi:serine/threonine protein phosphatase PrpC
MSNKPLADTLEMPTLVDYKYLPAGAVSSLVKVEMAAESDKGKVRHNNEDHFLVARFDRTMRMLLSNLARGTVPEECTESAYAMLVADGLGGHSAGEVASETAIVALIDLVLRTPDWIMRLDEELVRDVLDRMEKKLEAVNEVVNDRSKNEPELAGMGTTMTLAATLGTDAMIAHVGDSRAYLMRQGELSQLTRDHTVAQDLVDVGVLAPEEVSTHACRHILTNVIGGKGNRIRVELHHLRLQDGDQLLLCTDGLSEMAADDDISEVLHQSVTATEACRCLIGLALAGGGQDNVTVALARYRLAERSAFT